MTLATYAEKGADMRITFDTTDGPMGRILIAATPLGICAVKIGDTDRELEAGLRAEFPRAEVRRDPELLRFARERLRLLLEGGAWEAALPLDVRATAFQARVWESLRSIPYGETRTYAEVARTIGRPTAARAVARACATNPVAILVPCHRVVGSAGDLRGYRWGVRRKRALLDRERARAGRLA